MAQDKISGEELLCLLRESSVDNKPLTKDETEKIMQNRELLKDVPGNIIREELEKLLCGSGAGRVLREYADALAAVIPELEPLFGFPQISRFHNSDVWEHTIRTIENITPDPVLRMTMLLHDIGKPECCTIDDNGGSHFRNHPHVGARTADIILRRFGYDEETVRLIHYLIDTHDGHIEPEKSCVRGWLDEAGPEVMDMVIAVMIADACGKTDEARDEWYDILTKTEDCMNEMIASGEWKKKTE